MFHGPFGSRADTSLLKSRFRIVVNRLVSSGLFPCTLALSGGGCSSSNIAAHELDLGVDYDGVHTQAVLAFADFDPTAFDTPGDSTCGLFSGNCEQDRPMEATIVSGNAPIHRATMTAGLNGGWILYDVTVKRAADDPQVPNDDSSEPFLESSFLVTDGFSELGEPTGCTSEPAHPCTMTLSAR
jgi:hypothetical protein